MFDKQQHKLSVVNFLPVLFCANVTNWDVKDRARTEKPGLTTSQQDRVLARAATPKRFRTASGHKGFWTHDQNISVSLSKVHRTSQSLLLIYVHFEFCSKIVQPFIFLKCIENITYYGFQTINIMDILHIYPVCTNPDCIDKFKPMTSTLIWIAGSRTELYMSISDILSFWMVCSPEMNIYRKCLEENRA